MATVAAFLVLAGVPSPLSSGLATRLQAAPQELEGDAADPFKAPANADAKGAAKQPAKERSAVVLEVVVPLDAAREQRLIASLDRLASKATGTDRPMVVLEFARGEGSAPSSDREFLGRGTPFERALTVARWLTSAKGNRLQTVAYAPESLAGHAVLIALACEEIAIPLDAEFGQAGIDESDVDKTILQAYKDIAERRGNSIPQAAVVSMVDPRDPLYRVDTIGGAVEYVSSSELQKRERKQEEWKEEQLVPNNQLAWFRGQELRAWRWIAYTASDREQLASAMRLNVPLMDESVFDGPRVAARTQLHGIITPRIADRLLRAIEQALSDSNVNLLLIELDTPGGNLVESLRVAQYIADIPRKRAEVVCYLRSSARGDAALIALACGSIYIHPEATLGGPGEASISPQDLLDQRVALETIAQTSGRSVGEFVGLTSPDTPIFEYTSFDGRRQLSSPEWLKDDPEVPQWNQGNRVSFQRGLRLNEAEDLGLASGGAVSIEVVGDRFGLASLPPALKTNFAEQWVDWLASQMWLSLVLFAIGITALSAEMSSPGIGFPGIVAAVCFGLFFWLRFLDGTVEWLEVILIVGGVVCLLMEIFIMPGFGIFGVSGLVLLGLGVLLAGQTFVWPTNDYQRGRVVEGFGQIGLVFFALVGLAILFRKQIMNSPMIRWLALEVPTSTAENLAAEELQDELRTFVGWRGESITRCNPLGRASVGGRIWNVVSDDGWIDEDTEIVVTGVRDQKLVVKMSGTPRPSPTKDEETKHDETE